LERKQRVDDIRRESKKRENRRKKMIGSNTPSNPLDVAQQHTREQNMGSSCELRGLGFKFPVVYHRFNSYLQFAGDFWYIWRLLPMVGSMTTFKSCINHQNTAEFV